MSNPDDNKSDGPGTPPWWSEDATDESQLPEGFPQRPDLRRVDELRAKLKAQKAKSGGHHRTRLHDRLEKDDGRSARDIGTYTLIPMMMVAGPAMGYLLGHFLQLKFGGEPWLGVGGLLFGLVAAVRQIVLMMSRKNQQAKGEHK